MSYDACIKICRAFDSNAINGPARGSGEVFDLGGMRFLQRESAPVVIDHDRERPVGEVHELVVWPLSDGRWVVARARLDAPPGWLRTGTPASFSYRVLRSYPIGDWRVISSALVDEISIVSSSHRAVDPLANVALLRHAPATPTPQTVPLEARRRPSGQARPAPVGTIVYTPPGATLRRPGGEIIGVR